MQGQQLWRQCPLWVSSRHYSDPTSWCAFVISGRQIPSTLDLRRGAVCRRKSLEGQSRKSELCLHHLETIRLRYDVPFMELI